MSSGSRSANRFHALLSHTVVRISDPYVGYEAIMNENEISYSISKQSNLLMELLNAPTYAITEVAKNNIKEASVSGVYLISLSGSNEILYIGKNESQTVYGRAWQHVYTGATSDLKAMIKLYDDLPQELTEYQIRWIQIDDPRERHFFEAFAMGVLCTRMNFKKK